MNRLEGGHMIPRTAARTRVPLLAAVLVALQFFAPSASFAFAHTSRDVVANAQPGVVLSGPASHEERVACHDSGRSGNAHGPARLRDRHRTASAPRPEPAERPLPHRNTSAAEAPAASGTEPGHRSRPPTDHSPAALQVFRC
ncbi:MULTISPECIES: hypothetical protein [Streptomyces]|uniref:Secreted protein n=1 Tax=Streptomyces lienomycini TaxID=284035 RepID=A0ABV9WSB1_9ACTN|nr:hypothetical protein [Streptomyces lienomycini]